MIRGGGSCAVDEVPLRSGCSGLQGLGSARDSFTRGNRSSRKQYHLSHGRDMANATIGEGSA